mmetsp:Transcript_25838/g.45644  ORF Transcript_25838/g.45644 Transcript_25838/m.45644 type:complete len:340 (+) Transcript_25838:4541-5560(+)
MRHRPSSSVKSLHQITPKLFVPELSRPASAAGLTMPYSHRPLPSGDSAIHGTVSPTNFKLDSFVGSLTLDSFKPVDLSNAALFKMLSPKAPKRTSFSVKFQKPLKRAMTFENYITLKTGDAKIMKPHLPITTTALHTPTTSLSKLLSAKKPPQLRIDTKPEDIVVNGRPLTASLPSSSRAAIRPRKPRPKKPAKISEGVGPVAPSQLRSGKLDMQEELKQKMLATITPPKSNDYTEQPSFFSSYSEFESSAPGSKMFMSPKYKDADKLKQSPFARKKSALKLPTNQELMPEAQPNKALTVRFEVKVAQRPQTAGKLKKGRSLVSPLSSSHLGLRSLRLS